MKETTTPAGDALKEMSDRSDWVQENWYIIRRSLLIAHEIDSGKLTKTIRDDDPHEIRIAKSIQNVIVDHLKEIRSAPTAQ